MISLYIHLPFCDQKCKYCSFQVIPCDKLESEEKMMDEYVMKVKEEIASWGFFLSQQQRDCRVDNTPRNDDKEDRQKQEVKSLYFGGGTPNKIGEKRLMELIDCVADHFDLESLGELSIELNPYPEAETLDLIVSLQKKYKHFSRIRRSIGVQTFDSDILQESGRSYSFPAMVDFLRQLRNVKEMTSVFNFDFIAFGKFNKSKKGNSLLRDEYKQKFFQEFVHSQFADGFSLYTLELFSGSEWAKTPDQEGGIYCQKYGSEDDVHDEFHRLKNTVLDAGYRRYELSNFGLTGKGSIHNRVYRNMENYIALGTSASSFINFSQGQFADVDKQIFSEKLGIEIPEDTAGIRRTNTPLLGEYLKDKIVDKSKIVILDKKNYQSEAFFLALRTNEGVKAVSNFEDVLEKNRRQKIAEFEKHGLCVFSDDKLVLKDAGMDVYNSMVTELMREV